MHGWCVCALCYWLLTFAVGEDDGECNLKPWLSDALAAGEEGLHVVCVRTGSSAHLYQGGVATSSPLKVDWEAASFRKEITRLLNIKDTIKYDPPGHKSVQWRKQPWTVFTAKGKELRPGSEAKVLSKNFGKQDSKAIVLLLFEGGAWRWPTIQVGYVRRVLPGVFLRTVSRVPALFEVFLEAKEGEEVGISPGLLSNAIDLAQQSLGPSMTEGKVAKTMRSSDQTFLSYDTNDKLKELQTATGQLLRAPHENLEHLQVLRYQKGQHYDAHRDYWDPREFPDVPRFTNAEGYWHQRHATLLWYLSPPQEGGETWFPRAHGGPMPYGEWTACDERGAKVVPANVTAVLFYSLKADGDIDEFSWHCGCPVKKGVKWAANSWLRNSPSGPRDKNRRALKTEL